MSRATAVKLIKFLLVIGLMTLVFRSVQWDDRLLTARAGADAVEETVSIRGAWSSDRVVVVDGSGNERTVQPGKQADGSEIELAPGFLTYWRNLDVTLFVLGAACYFVTVLVAGARWWWLLRVNGLNVTLLESLRFTWIGVFFNTVVPGATGGDLIKAIYIMKHCPGQRVPALVSVIVDRVLGLASLAILGALVVLFALDRFGDLAIAIWSVIGGLALLFSIAFSRRLRSLVRLKWMLERLPKKLGNVLRMLDEAVFVYRGHKNVVLASLLAGVANHVVSVMSVVFIGDALGVGMPWTEYFVLIPVINIISAVPLMPNGWGLGEVLYQKLFATYGASYIAGAGSLEAGAKAMGTRAVALSVLYRLHTTLWSLLAGLLVLFGRDRVTQQDIAAEQQREDAGG